MNRISDIIFKLSPAYIIGKGISNIWEHIKHIRNTRKVKNVPVFKEPEVQDVLSTIKKSKQNEDSNSFIGEFKYPKEGPKNMAQKKREPMELKPGNIELLNRSIVISLYDMDLGYRDDLQFIGISRINGKGIYRYIGKDFSKFDLPYEEVVSLNSTYSTVY